jgi:hypothetical protein
MKTGKRKKLLKKMPMGVRIIGGWHYLGAVIVLIYAFLLIFVPDLLFNKKAKMAFRKK